MEIIRRGHRVTTVQPSLHFDRGDGSGYSFDLTDDRTAPVDYPAGTYVSETDPGAINFVLCCMGWMPKMVSYEVIEFRNSYWEPSVGRCACGEEVYLENDYGHGIDCECGRIYNQSGQELAPRSQWEDRYEDEDSVGYNVRFGYAGGPGEDY